MSAVGNAIAELEAKRAQIDDAIAVLRAVDGGSAPVVLRSIAPAGTAQAAPKPANGKRKPGTWATPETWAQARKLYEAGTESATIAKQLNVTTAAIYYHAAHDKPRWKRPKAPAAATGDQLPGKVHCPHCQLWTEHDPCSNCGKKVRK